MKFADEAEIFEFDLRRFAARVHFKIPGGHARDIEHPDFHAFAVNGGGKFGIGEISAVIPD